MKVIVPLDEQAGKTSRMSEHFGSAPFYAVADTEAGSFEIIQNTSIHHDHGQCTPADFFAEQGINVLLCKGIGAGAIAKLQMMGIEVYMATMASTLGDALSQFSLGILPKLTPQHACHGHDCH